MWVCADASFGCEKIRSSRDGNPISQNHHPALLPAEMLLSDETAESERESGDFIRGGQQQQQPVFVSQFGLRFESVRKED